MGRRNLLRVGGTELIKQGTELTSEGTGLIKEGADLCAQHRLPFWGSNKMLEIAKTQYFY